MTTRNRKVLSFVVFLSIMALVGQVWADTHTRLEGSLSDHDAMVVTTRASVGVTVGEGTVHLETGALRLAQGGPEGGFLRVTAVGLTPGSRYMVLTGRELIYAFSADHNGRFSARVTDRIQINETVKVRHSGRPFASGLTDLQVVDLSSAATGAVRLDRPMANGKRDLIETTPLCANNPVGAGAGEAMVMSSQNGQAFAVEGWGLPPFGELIVIADGITVGFTAADEFGFFDLLAGDDPNADVPLPPELDPVTDIDQILVVTSDQVTMLYGSFDQPCSGGGGGDPVDAGSISICSADDNLMIGWMDWMIFDDGLQTAMISAFELPPDVSVDVAFDSIFIGTVPTSDWGELFVIFSSDPAPGELPLPQTAPPLDEVQTVDLTSYGVMLGSGTDGEECDWIDPPEPVDQDFTNLCPAAGGDPGQQGYAGWTVWDDGAEDFFIHVAGLEPVQVLTLIVDGHDLGAFTTTQWGDLGLFFSSNPDGGGHGNPSGQDVLPLPDEIRPVSGIDLMSLVDGDVVVVEGSFVNPCDLPDPPQPVDQDYTNLCPVDDGNLAWGGTGWMVWDDGTEEFYVFVDGLEEQSTWNLIVDGHDLGAYTVSGQGHLGLYFSSNPDGGGGQGDFPGLGLDALPLPDEIRPVSSIDLVSLVSPDGAPIVAGSFVNPCDLPDPPLPVDEGYTDLCPVTTTMATGQVAWIEWDNGEEQLMVAVYLAEPAELYEIIIDGFDLGDYEANQDGFLWVDFSSDPAYDGQILLPDAVRPVSNIDVIEINNSQGTTIVAGSFSEPCGMEWEYESGYTGLCDAVGQQSGHAWWWINRLNGQVLEEAFEVFFWQAVDQMTYSVEVDGLDVGEMVLGDWWDDVLVLGLGTRGQPPVPDELSPISGIDIVRILDENGLEVSAGSYLNPCSEDESGGGGLINNTNAYVD